MTKWQITGIVLLLLLGSAALICGPVFGLCNEQVQSTMLWIAAVVAAIYAGFTARMARSSEQTEKRVADLHAKMAEMTEATRENAEASKSAASTIEQVVEATRDNARVALDAVNLMQLELILVHGTELHAQYRSASGSGEKEWAWYEIRNGGNGEARHVKIHPMWGAWEAGAPARIIHEDELEGVKRGQTSPDSHSDIEVLTLPSHATVGFLVQATEEDGAMLSIRWQDPARGRLRWRCYRLKLAKQKHRIVGRELMQTEVPQGPWCEGCRERVLEQCPHVVKKHDREEFLRESARLYQTSGWWEENAT